jgi:hypothetical protein
MFFFLQQHAMLSVVFRNNLCDTLALMQIFLCISGIGTLMGSSWLAFKAGISLLFFAYIYMIFFGQFAAYL